MSRCRVVLRPEAGQGQQKARKFPVKASNSSNAPAFTLPRSSTYYIKLNKHKRHESQERRNGKTNSIWGTWRKQVKVGS